MKNIPFCILFLVLSTFAMGTYASNTQTLVTKSFTVDITVHCPEGEVSCDNVDYFGRRNDKPDEQIKLRGATMTLNGGEGRFIGYEFKSGRYTYRVLDDGLLQIFRRKKLLQSEQGIWK